MNNASHEGRKRITPAAVCLIVGIVIGVLTDALGLWVCIGVAVGAVMSGLLASRRR